MWSSIMNSTTIVCGSQAQDTLVLSLGFLFVQDIFMYMYTYKFVWACLCVGVGVGICT